MTSNINKKAILALEDGTVFTGIGLGSDAMATGEVVFNTAMTGYQEILSDPSYARQMITLTYPHIGNTGCNETDEESNASLATGLIIRDSAMQSSNWRSESNLSEYLARQGIAGIAGIDTRELTRKLRTQGALRGCIMSEPVNENQAIEQAQACASLEGMDLAIEAGTRQPYEWTEGSHELLTGQWRQADSRFHVVACDYGCKRNILRLMADRGCRITVVPPDMPAKAILDMNPDGLFLSNGPGDPAACDYAIETVRELLKTSLPLFGICLGAQILALACDASTHKMKFGHHGANHPVQDLKTKQVMITSQNHGFAIDESTLPDNIRITHKSLFDGSIQGIELTDRPAFGFQGHPEASPGPHDIQGLFDHFINLMEEN